MKIELKNIEINDTLSRETNCFSADIHINGKKAGYAYNEGGGGPTTYHGDRALIAAAEEYCQTLPPAVYPGYKLEVKMNLEHYVDQIIDLAIEAKEAAKIEKKVQKDMDKGVLVGNKLENGYSYAIFQTKKPISQHTQEELKPILAHVRKRMSEDKKYKGRSILNTNIQLV